MTATFSYTSDFREEFVAETAALLRRRFIIFAASNLGLYIFASFFLPTLFAFLPVLRDDEIVTRFFAGWPGLNAVIILTLVQCGVSLVSISVVRRRRLRPAELLRLSQWVFVCMGVVSVASSAFINSTGFPWLLMFSHLLACMLLPWEPRQAMRPLLPLLFLNVAVLLIFSGASLSIRLVEIALSGLAAVPGGLACYLRHARRTERFKLRFLQSRYGQIRRDLTDARRIHESLFPPPHNKGPIRFDYRYEPMRQIGGDCLYTRFCPVPGATAQTLSALLVDVTGHGIAAALTVNRLYGEVERVFGEDPYAAPGDVLRALNRYVHLTLANHSVYATALCLRVDPVKGVVDWASGGHPPAFLRAVDGTIDRLPSTSFVLGAVPDEAFSHGQQSHRFGPGDTLIAYTDGATEARNEAGRMLGVTGLERILASAPPAFDGGWASVILSAVEAHRLGPARDDTLVVEIVRTLGLDTDALKTRGVRLREESPAAPAGV